jgi:hypothetical protein
MKGLQRLSFVWTGGAVGGLVNSFAVWAFGSLGITAAFKVAIAPTFTAPWLYQRMFWGGLWGLLLLAVGKGRGFQRIFMIGLGVSLFPTAAQLFYFLPRSGHQMGGFDLGALTPVFVVFFNAIWGWVAAWWALPAGRRLR